MVLLAILWREWLHAMLRIAKLRYYFAAKERGQWLGIFGKDLMARPRATQQTRIEQGLIPCYHSLMAKVTSKLQLTVPKAIADQYGIKPGDELEWVPAGDSIRVELVRGKIRAGQQLTMEERLALFDDNMNRVDLLQTKELEEARAKPSTSAQERRGWTREELYNDDRGLPRGFPRRH